MLFTRWSEPQVEMRHRTEPQAAQRKSIMGYSILYDRNLYTCWEVVYIIESVVYLIFFKTFSLLLFSDLLNIVLELMISL